MARVTQKDFGRRLGALRKKAGLTQDDASRAINISALTLSRLERGVQFTDFTVLSKLARVYGVEIADLFTLPDTGKTSPEDAAIERIVARLRTGDLEDIQRAAKVIKALFEPLPSRPKFPKRKQKRKNIAG